MSVHLKQGWERTTVADVIEDLQSGFASGQKSVSNGVSHLRMNNIGTVGELILDLVRKVPEVAAKTKYDLRVGDVLVCTTNSGKLVGKCAYFDRKGRFAFSNHLTRLRPDPTRINGSFLRWNLWLNWKQGLFDDKCKHWVNQSTLPKRALLESEILAPPIAQQQQLVAKLETLLSRIEHCNERLSKIPAILKRLRLSVVAAAAAGRLTSGWREDNTCSAEKCAENLLRERLALCRSAGERRDVSEAFDLEARLDHKTGWVTIPVWLVCDFITKGTTPTNGNMTPSGDIPFLKVYNIVDNKVDFEYKPQFVSRATHATLLARSKVYPGDVLMNIVGPPLGKIAIVPGQYPEWNINQALAIFRPIRSILPQYLHAALLGGDSVQSIIAETRGIVGQSNISLEQCRALSISVPPLSEQREIVRRVERLFKFADKVERRFLNAKGGVNSLAVSVLTQAFRGELT